MAQPFHLFDVAMATYNKLYLYSTEDNTLLQSCICKLDWGTDMRTSSYPHNAYVKKNYPDKEW